MNRTLLCFGFAVCLGMSHFTGAGEFNRALKIGDAAPTWSNLPGTDGKRHSLDDWKDKDFLVLVFTCNSCPTARDYEDRILAFAKKHAGQDSKTALVAVNVNKIPEDSLEKMNERAKERGFPFVYMFDETQKIAKDYGATYTPEFFILDRERKVVYMGGFDDASNVDRVKNHYLEPALLALHQGQTPKPAETPAIGCTIRYARERRPAKP